jgi:hypothetical protein
MQKLLDRKTIRQAASVADRLENVEQGLAEILELLKVVVIDPRESRRGRRIKRFKYWCDDEQLLPRTGYKLIDDGEVESVIIGERSRYILLDSWDAYLARLAAVQKAAPRPTVNPPPRRGGLVTWTNPRIDAGKALQIAAQRLRIARIF